MQKDIHYYGTYAIARAAGLKPNDAQVIAYSAQFVDDSTETNSQPQHKDGGLIYGVATAHHSRQSVFQFLSFKFKKNTRRNPDLYSNVGQRRMWVPFHFYPGNEGSELSERLMCRKDSKIVNEMFDNHINRTKENLPYILHLIGIASHVYIDTFSHYGFSGVSSRNNKVDQSSFKFLNKENEINKYMKKFRKKEVTLKKSNNWRNQKQGFLKQLSERFPKIAGYFASLSTGALGHGSVATCPDLPFLEWHFKREVYKKHLDNRSIFYLMWYRIINAFKNQNNNSIEKRCNPETFVEGCEKLYNKLHTFSKKLYGNQSFNFRKFSDIKPTIVKIIERPSSVEKGENERINFWLESIENGSLFELTKQEFLDYNHEDWENQKDINKLSVSDEAIKLNVYKFHQAADYHRHYTLKQLLPKYGIVVN